MDLLGRRQLALLLTLLTERVRLDVAVTDALPASAVSFVGRRVAFVLVVLFVHYLLMFGTVLPAVCEPTAAGVGAGTPGFIWHRFTTLGTRKALRDCSHKALLDSIFLIIILSGVAGVIQCLFVSTSGKQEFCSHPAPECGAYGCSEGRSPYRQQSSPKRGSRDNVSPVGSGALDSPPP